MNKKKWKVSGKVAHSVYKDKKKIWYRKHKKYNQNNRFFLEISI
jgi:hypothetical protein